MTTTVEQALVFFSAAVILVPIFRFLRLGSVLGYLMAGLLVGPQGLSLISNPQNILHFAELGIIFLLFIIGLEIHPSKLWSLRRQLFGLGGSQIILSTLVFSGIAIFFDLPPILSVLLGLSLSLSSTAFAIQTLVERNQLKTEFGQSSFGVLLMQDLMAIPTLAIIPFINSKGAQSPALQDSLLVLLIILFLLFVGRFLIRPLFRLIAGTRVPEIFTAATLFIVLGVAILMQKAGVSAALGTFIAGVLLSDSEYRHELEANLEPFKGLLMGLFFMAVGMGVDLNLIVERPLSIFALALGYLFLKVLILYLTGRLFRLSPENARRMAITISQGGEFAFVIFAQILQMQLAPSSLMAILTAMITLSMALNPLLALLYDEIRRKQKGTRPVVPSEEFFAELKAQSPEVIIAGFGRFGQIFGRVLKAQNIPFVAIDHDPEQIELLGRFGNKVYYGDASRKDLLEAAGAARAKYFILCIDEVEASLRTAETVVKNYPHLKVFSRARNRGHNFDLLEVGVHQIKRETFDSSLNFVGDLLADMGTPRAKVDFILEKFKNHDEIMLQEQYKVRGDDKMFMTVSKQGANQLFEVLRDDQSQTYIEVKPS